jgi:intracellular sulfur oxidation DsrE/DsrF family protein
MKTYINLILALVFSVITFAQEKPVKIVFDVTSDNIKVHGSTMRHVKAMSEAYPDSKFEVVMYSGAMDMVLKDKTSVAADMEEMAKNENVSFVICEGTMKRYQVDVSQLIPGVTTVPEGILQIIKLQAEGWGYIKEAQ